MMRDANTAFVGRSMQEFMACDRSSGLHRCPGNP
jgi:hypothetical protein